MADITLGDLYREVVAMRSEVTGALLKLAVIESRNAEADRIHLDQEGRLRALERFRFTVAGYSVLGGLVTGVLGALLERWIAGGGHG